MKRQIKHMIKHKRAARAAARLRGSERPPRVSGENGSGRRYVPWSWGKKSYKGGDRPAKDDK